MESRDPPADDDSPALRTRPPRTALHLDASKFRLDPPLHDTQGAPQTPPPPATGPPPAHARPRALTQGAPSGAGPSAAHGRSRAATVANPPKSAPPGSAVPEKEKRKRSRVTPEQLTHLERIFAVDKSPTAAKRKEISEMLGMQERQTQIWFQNRRAKAKTLEGKGRPGPRGSPTSGGDSPPDTPPDFGAPPDVDLQTLIHEDEPVSFIPCSDLSIGSWRRISATLGQHDLLAYISAAKRCLTWFIYSNGYGFKMEIPFDSITTTAFNAASPGQGLASFFLARPPLFYLESVASPTTQLGTPKIWKKCADWTEGQQATKILRHDLVAAALPLVNALKTLPGAEHLPPLPPGGAAPYPPPDIMAPMHIPPPPMAGLEPPPAFPLAAGTLAHFIHGRKRSFSGPPAPAQASHDIPSFALLGDPQAGSSDAHSPFPAAYPGQRTDALSFPPEYSTALYRPFPSVQPPAAAHQPHSSLGDFSTVPISHAAARPYSASAVDTRFPFDSHAPPAVLHAPSEHYPSAEGRPPTQFASSMSASSPTLLTSAFDPAGRHRNVRLSESAGLDMETSRFGGDDDDPGQHSAPHDPSFDAASLAMASQHDPSQAAS